MENRSEPKKKKKTTFIKQVSTVTSYSGVEELEYL